MPDPYRPEPQDARPTATDTRLRGAEGAGPQEESLTPRAAPPSGPGSQSQPTGPDPIASLPDHDRHGPDWEAEDREDRDGSSPRRPGIESSESSQGDRSDPQTDLLTQEKATFGGVKVGSALLGWLTTVGTIAVLVAVVAAVAGGLDIDANSSTSDLSGVGLGAAIALLVLVFLGYLAGGYVAGRMARFHGVRQGLTVWLWGLIITIGLSIASAIIGDQTDLLARANLPQIPLTSDGLTWQVVVGLAAVLLAGLGGATLGGLLGMRFHRRIDRFAAMHTPTGV